MFSPDIVVPAIGNSFAKLHPRVMVRNPVMFVVEIGSVYTTILFVRDLGSSTGAENVFAGLVAAFLWATVLFANFAEAMAEGRGKAQGSVAAQGPYRDHRQPPPRLRHDRVGALQPPRGR